jgi:hypothetical protein
MKRIAEIALIVASATFLTVGIANAQNNVVQATVPFSFTVGNNTLPAGTYRIASMASSAHVLGFSSWQKGVNVLAMGSPDQSNPEKADILVFHKYRNLYFLSDIRCADSAMNVHFAVTKAEKRARAQVEEAGLFVDDPVLIALN